MALAIGTDIVEIQRIADVVERQGDKFVQRILTDAEQQEYLRLNCALSFLAKRFAAKEAVAKALGTGIGHGVSFRDINIIKTERGAPAVELSGGAATVLSAMGGSQILLSLAGERQYAVAYAVLT